MLSLKIITGGFFFALLQVTLAVTQLIPVYVSNDTVQYYVSRSDADLPIATEGRVDKRYGDTDLLRAGNPSVPREVYWPTDQEEAQAPVDNHLSTESESVNSDLAEGSSNNAYFGHQYGWGWGTPSLSHGHHGLHGQHKVYHYKVLPAKHGWHLPKQTHYHLGWDSHQLGWGWGIKNFGHDVLDTIDGWFGWKSWDLSGVKHVLTTIAIGIPFVAGLVVLILLTPVPVLIQAVARSPGVTTTFMEESSRLAKKVLTSDECVEKIVCELAALQRKYDKSNIAKKIWQKLPLNSKWTRSVTEATEKVLEARRSRQSSKLLNLGGNIDIVSISVQRDCQIYKCKLTQTVMDIIKNWMMTNSLRTPDF